MLFLIGICHSMQKYRGTAGEGGEGGVKNGTRNLTLPGYVPYGKV